jgi:ferredoxin
MRILVHFFTWRDYYTYHPLSCQTPCGYTIRSLSRFNSFAAALSRAIIKGKISKSCFSMIPQPLLKLNSPPAASRFVPTDLLTWPLLGSFLCWRHARRTMQMILLIASSFIIFDGLFGPQQAPKNLATVATWVHYRGLVVLAMLMVGNLFCMACPFMLPRELGRWLGLRLGWQSVVPSPLRHKWLAVTLLMLFFVSYELFSLWASPWLTAWIIIAYFLTAIVVDTFFQGAAFCKYVCPLGQFNFFGSLTSPAEIKIRQPAICAACRTKDCIAGNKLTSQRGCELWLFQEKKVGNMDCTFCLDCIQACPHDNIGLIARIPTQELWADPRRSGVGRFSQRWDLAALVIVLTFGAYLNAFGMITPVYALRQSVAQWLGLTSEIPSLLLIFGLGFTLVPALLLMATSFLSRLMVSQTHEPLSLIIRRFVYSLAPLGFGMWLAHYAFHFLTGALTLIPVMQAYLNDSGFEVGQPYWQLGPLVPPDWLFPIQAIFLYLGLLGGLVTAFQISMAHYKNRTLALRAFGPWAVLLLLLLVAALWIMFQPMEMRGTIFMGLPLSGS